MALIGPYDLSKFWHLFPMLYRLWRANRQATFWHFCFYQVASLINHRWEWWLWPDVPIKGQTAVDVGASMGQWTLPLAKRFDFVLAFEPAKDLADKLARRLQSSQVRVMPFALWNRATWHTLITYPDLRVSRLVEHDLLFSIGLGTGRREVQCLPLDFFSLSDLDFMKVDVEGAEGEVLEGAYQTLKRCHPVILVELHAQAAREKVESILTSLGYTWEYRHYPYYRPGDGLYEKRLWIVARMP